ncbi:MAG TPA: integrase arm-type DNA-binding domain-containing protein [bacterium]|nr:integrase arm-type DNA-binding domain-containing protein [bacterium]
MRKTLSLGVYPDVDLKLARERRDEARRLLAQTPAGVLFQNWFRGAVTSGENAGTQKRFVGARGPHGLARGKAGGVRIFDGLRIGDSGAGEPRG